MVWCVCVCVCVWETDERAYTACVVHCGSYKLRFAEVGRARRADALRPRHRRLHNENASRPRDRVQLSLRQTAAHL